MNTPSTSVALLSLAAAVVSLAASHQASAAPPALRTAATATFTSQDANSCLSTESSAFVRRNASGQTRLQFRLLRVNNCTGQGLADLRVDRMVPLGAFRATPDLSLATLDLAVQARDTLARKNRSVNIHLVWRASEPMIKAARGDEAVAQGSFQRTAIPVQRSMRLSQASGRVSIAGVVASLGNAESAWIETTTGR